MLDPEVETLGADELRLLEEAAFARQVDYLFARSPFYAERLRAAGFTPERPPRLADLPALPCTSKEDIRRNQEQAPPLGSHMACDWRDVVRLYSSSGTTGRPCYVGVTRDDLESWLTIAGRAYRAAGVGPGVRIITTAGAGPFVAGAALDVFAHLGATVIPLGPGQTDRLVAACRWAAAGFLACTPSYAFHLVDWCTERGINPRGLGLSHLCVAGEPGGGVPSIRGRIESLTGSVVTESMGLADVSPSVWGECEQRDGMHCCGQGFVHVELIDPETGMLLPWEEGVEGEPVYTAIRRQCVPLLRFRSHDRARVTGTGRCGCGRTAARIRCIGRSDDMLIVRGVNVFPAAVRDVITGFAPRTTGQLLIRPTGLRPSAEPPVTVAVEYGRDAGDLDGLRAEIETRLRERLVFRARVELVPGGALGRSQYKGRWVAWESPEPGPAGERPSAEQT